MAQKPKVLFIWSFKEKVCQPLPCMMWFLTPALSPHCPSLPTQPTPAVQPQWPPVPLSNQAQSSSPARNARSWDLCMAHSLTPSRFAQASPSPWGLTIYLKSHAPLYSTCTYVCCPLLFLFHSTSHLLTYCLNYLFLHLLFFGCFPNSGLKHKSRAFCLFCSLMHPKCLEQWLAYCRFSIKTCWDALNFGSLTKWVV